MASVFLKTSMQGAATSVRAATDPTLTGRGGAYMMDCQAWRSARRVAVRVCVASTAVRVQEAQPNLAAVSEEQARALWEYSERVFREHFERPPQDAAPEAHKGAATAAE
jgi:hypothetical protein